MATIEFRGRRFRVDGDLRAALAVHEDGRYRYPLTLLDDRGEIHDLCEPDANVLLELIRWEHRGGLGVGMHY